MKTITPSRRAFSLIELIIVVSIIVIIAALTLPAMNTLLRGSQMNQGSGILVAQLNLARQQALSHNHKVEVRFYRYGDPEIPGEKVNDSTTGKFRAMQIFEERPDLGGRLLPLDKVQLLPGGVIFSYSDSDGLSSIIDKGSAGAPTTGNQDPNAVRLPRGIDFNYDYVAFRFNPDGSTNLSPSKIWCLTIVGANDKLDSPTKPPPNFFTVQVDPATGVTRSYRPTVS